MTFSARRKPLSETTRRGQKSDAGKWAEREVRVWLEARTESDLTFKFHRYPDARAARGALPPQPADYIVAWRSRLPPGVIGNRPKHVYHLEVKETAQLKRLPRAKVRQYGMLFAFHLAGVEAYLPIFRSAYGDWVLLGPDQLFAEEDCPPSFDLTFLKPYPSAAALLEELFHV